jgi:hypothetical protein
VSGLWHVMFWVMLPVALAACIVAYDNVRGA